jgi:hypothetical protein
VTLVRRSPRSAGLARAIVTEASRHAVNPAGPLPAAVTNGFSVKWEYRIYFGCR